MAELKNLIDAIRSLIFDADKRAAFDKDQTAFLAECGAADATPAQVHQAVQTVAAEVAPDFGARLTAAVSQSVSGSSFGTGAATAVAQTADAGSHAVVAEQHAAAVRAIQQVTQVTNNYSVTRVDDRDTNVVTTNNNNITAGGDVNVENEGPLVASGDGAAAVRDANVGVLNTGTNTGVQVGDDSNAPIVTGTNTGVVTEGDVRNVNTGTGIVQDNDGSIVGPVTAGFGDGDVAGAGGIVADGPVAIADRGGVLTTGDNNDVNVARGGGAIFGAGDGSPTNIGGVQATGGGQIAGGDIVRTGAGSQVNTGGGDNVDIDRSTVATGGGQANTNQVGTEGGSASGVATNQANQQAFGAGADDDGNGGDGPSIGQSIEQQNTDGGFEDAPETQTYVNVVEPELPVEEPVYVSQQVEQENATGMEDGDEHGM